MIETIALDTRKVHSPVGKPRISPLRRGERNNVTLTVAERARVSAEESREQAEHARKQAESTRASSETLRALSETSRAEAESQRTQAESLRVDAETKREEAFSKSVEKANAATESAAKVVADAQTAIAEVKATEAKLYPAAENILVGSETGAVAHVEDAFAGASLRKITVDGACKQDGTPSPDNPVPIQSIENPIVKVTGNNSEPKETRIDLKGNELCSVTENLVWNPKTFKDELVIDSDGNAILTKRVFSAHVELSEQSYLGNTDKFQYFNYQPKTVRPIDGSYAIRSNRFGKLGREPWNFYIAGGRNAAFFFTFPLGTFANIDELKEWLVKNPIDVYYLGAETQAIQLGKIEMPTLPESVINVWTDAEVTTNTGIMYVRDVNIVISNLESAIASITEG